MELEGRQRRDCLPPGQGLDPDLPRWNVAGKKLNGSGNPVRRRLPSVHLLDQNGGS